METLKTLAELCDETGLPAVLVLALWEVPREDWEEELLLAQRDLPSAFQEIAIWIASQAHVVGDIELWEFVPLVIRAVCSGVFNEQFDPQHPPDLGPVTISGEAHAAVSAAYLGWELMRHPERRAALDMDNMRTITASDIIGFIGDLLNAVYAERLRRDAAKGCEQ